MATSQSVSEVNEEPVQNLDLVEESQPKSSQDPAAFAIQYLQGLAAPARDRQTILVFELDTLRKQIIAAQEELLNLQIREEDKKQELKRHRDWITCCENLGELSHDIEPYIKLLPTPKQIPKPQLRGDQVFSTADALKIFEDNPKSSLSNREVIDLAVEIKRDSARMPGRISQIVNYLYTQGKLARVGEGVYRLKEKPEQAIQEAMPVMTELVETYKPVDMYEERLDNNMGQQAASAEQSRTVILEMAPPKKRGRPSKNIPKSSVGTPLKGGLSLPHLRKPEIVAAKSSRV